MEIRILDVQLEVEEIKISTSDYKSFRKYLNDGFSAYETVNGMRILKRGSKVWVTIEYNEKCSIIDIQKTLLQYYKEKDTIKLCNFFKKDLKENKVKLTIDSNGYCALIEK